MSSTATTTALEHWFRSNSGYLHLSIRILENDESGVHYRSTKPIEHGAAIASAPHTVTLSYLNALVDERLPVFKQQRHQFKVEAIGFFYLMAQYINREESFWKPYLDSLPSPGEDFSQPLFYEELDDVAWLEHTDVWHTVTARKEVYKEYFADGIAVLEKAGIDTVPYTWHLFKWAATIFTSRSFSSRALHPEGGKYWTTYKYTADGRRQTVLLDMSRTPAEDLDFPVLFPGLDAANHNHDAHVDWAFDPGRFSISSTDGLEGDAEVFNNYGPKGNGELLIGYGFCILDNPYDTVALTLKAPPKALLSVMKASQAGYFNPTGEWSAEKATFRLPKPPTLAASSAIFRHLPESLLELLFYIIRYERSQAFDFISQPLDYLNAEGSKYLPHIARMIAQSLIQKLVQLQSVQLPSKPRSRRQIQAAIYRGGQVTILQDIIAALKNFTRSLIWTPSAEDFNLPPSPCLVKLEDFLESLVTHDQFDDAFLDGIQASANTRDLEQLRLAGWEEELWVLLLCYLRLDLHDLNERIVGPIPADLHPNTGMDEENVAGLRQARMALDLVRTAAEAFPDTLWADERWDAEYIAAVGGDVLKHDSFMVMCTGSDGEEAPRLFVYMRSATR